MKLKNIAPALVVASMAFLSSCGGGGSSDNTPAPAVAPPKPTLDEVLDTPGRVVDITKLSEENKSKYLCIESMCGVNYAFEHEIVKKPELAVSYKAIVQKSLDRKIKLYMGQVIKNEQALNQVMLTLVKTDEKKMSIAKEQIAFINAFTALADFGKYYGAVENDSTGEVVINAEKLKKINPQLTQIEVDALKSLEGILSQFLGREVDALTAPLWIDAFKKRPSQPDATEEEALKSIADFTLNFKTKNDTVYLTDLVVSDSEYILEKAQKKEALSLLQKVELLKTYQKYSKRYSIVTNTKVIEAFSKVPLSINKTIIKMSQNYEKHIGPIYADKTKIRKTFNEAVEKCSVSLVKSYANTPAASENQRASDMLKLIIAKANQLGAAKSTLASVNPLVVQVNLPPNQDEVIANWSTLFDGAKNSISKVSSFIDKQAITENNLSSQLFVALFIKYYKAPELFSDVVTTCERTEPAFLSDAALPSQKVFNASWVTVKNLAYGAGIMAHEIGHIASVQWNEAFKKERGCLSANYGSNQYVEEDLADLFSSKILTEIFKTDKTQKFSNMSCGFPTFKTLKFDEITLENESPGDSHSSELYRLFAVAKNMKTMTNQCSQFLSKFQPQNIFGNYCEWHN